MRRQGVTSIDAFSSARSITSACSSSSRRRGGVAAWRGGEGDEDADIVSPPTKIGFSRSHRPDARLLQSGRYDRCV